MHLIDSPTVTLWNTIVTDNTAGTASSSNISGTVSTASSYNNLVGPSSKGTGGLSHNNQGNYVLGASEGSGVSASLAFNGGPTRTHALLSTSPAIDRGTSAVVDAYFAVLDLKDQRKLSRVVDWDGIGGERIDIGTVELAIGETHL